MPWRSRGNTSIFAERYLSEVLEGTTQRIKQVIDAESTDRVLAQNQSEYVQELVTQYSVPEVAIHRQGGYATTREEQIPAELFPRNFHTREGKTYPKQVITFHLPYSGNRDLLPCRPSRWIMWTEAVEITASEITFDLINFSDNAEDINRQVERTVSHIAEQLENVLKDVGRYNSGLSAQVRQLVATRQQQLANRQKVMSGLSFPVRSESQAAFSSRNLEHRVQEPTKMAATPRSNAGTAPGTGTEAPTLVDGALASVFISYGGPDEAFAERLNRTLSQRGVRTFLFKQHAIPGQKLHRVMRDGVNRHDRVVLLCSRNSLDRPGVVNELEETLQREAREGGASVLIPITLDDYVFSTWAPERPDIAQSVRDRVVADFRRAATDQAVYDGAVERLLNALKPAK